MLFGIDTTYIWLALAVILAIVEMSTTSLVSIWFVMGSLFVSGDESVEFLVFFVFPNFQIFG